MAVYDKNGDKIASLNSINVLEFGAKGDGVTDDYASIQSALDSLSQTGILLKLLCCFTQIRFYTLRTEQQFYKGRQWTVLCGITQQHQSESMMERITLRSSVRHLTAELIPQITLCSDSATVST